MEELYSQVCKVLQSVADPEIPVVSVVDLGIVRGARLNQDLLEVDVTPTYSGCPALEIIESEIVAALKNAGYAKVKLNRVLSPAWSTDWISESGKEKLRAYGIAPPLATEDSGESGLVTLGGKQNLIIPCPACGSKKTKITSEFGATACKALCVCEDCREPFEYFKAF